MCFVFRVCGQAALTLVVLVGAIVIFGGIAMVFLAISFLNSSYGFQASEKALASAASGVNDALLRLDRDHGFSTAGECVPYAASCASGSATVTVTQDSPVAGEVTITSDASYSFTERKVKAIASVSSSTGAVTLVSWKEITF